ncbi:hypothetical protein K474DRAFT_1600700 [Panus rudis PR-1116 ss-1]|nr:hypothetical protein K474DRAFT_1600700 [Panus rudis PR-1116 ss-1]
MTNAVNLPPHPDLQSQREKLRSILQAIPTFEPGIVDPPIIDASLDSRTAGEDEPQRKEAVHGLRHLRDAVRRDLDVLDKFLNDPACADLPALSTNAPYLISVWNEVLLAPQPVVGIWSTFSESGKNVLPRQRGQPKDDSVKVDVVADGGKRWIRVNTIKNSRILAEFREIDSYITDSEDEDDLPSGHPPKLAPTEFDNSILRMARSLLNAAKNNPVPGTDDIPSLTLQLTRLDPAPSNSKEFDPRISQTLDVLRDLGVEVRLGERDEAELSRVKSKHKPAQPQSYRPTRKINLDLSILIALVSDITHSPLPSSPEDADRRFTPSEQYMQWKKTRLSLYDPKSTVDDIARPSRALSNQAIQEMAKGLFQDMHERLAEISTSSDTPTQIEFWTTPEAKDRCLKIVSKIGGPAEKRRAQALFQSSDISLAGVEASYWKDSRYPRGYIPLLPIHMLPSSQPPDDLQPPATDEGGTKLSQFFSALADTCRDILAQETMPDPRTLRELPGSDEEKSNADKEDAEGKLDPADDEEDADGEIQRATVTKANPRLTAHTVQSLLWGAIRGWTTLTANKTSVKAIIREMKSRRAIWERVQGEGRNDEDDSGVGIAALWMVDPRSLAEGMRSDFGST